MGTTRARKYLRSLEVRAVNLLRAIRDADNTSDTRRALALDYRDTLGRLSRFSPLELVVD